MISDVKVVNDLLPLILLVNERHVKAEPIASLQQHYANDDHCWPLRFESAWNDTTTMVWLLEVLRKALRDILSEYSICLLLDVASCHISDRVITKAARSGFKLVIIPAGMTSLLQPLDVYVFARYKRALTAAFERLGHASPNGHVRSDLFLREILDVAKEVLFGSKWDWAFRKCGFGEAQTRLGSTLKATIPDVLPPGGLAPELPTLLELRSIWPQGKVIPIGWLFQWCNVKPEVFEAAAEEIEREQLPAPHVNPWIGRLRSSSALVAVGSSARPSESRAQSSADTWRATPAAAKRTALAKKDSQKVEKRG